ncbi:MAG: universal stress protein, partial [Terriglobus sp.]
LDLVNVLNLALNGADYGGGTMPLDVIAQGNEVELRHERHRFEDVATVITLLESFAPVEALLAHAAETQPQLIVMGTTSKSGLEKLVLGSTAEQIFRRSTIPVLTVGPHAKLPERGTFNFRTIVYAASSSDESRKAATFAYAFAQDSGAHVYVCHVLPEHETTSAAKEEAQKTLQRLIPPGISDWCTPECVVESGKAPEAILALAERVQADLIVLGPRENSFALKYLEPGITPQILATATCPVLTVR